jgi:hypothetical protein
MSYSGPELQQRTQVPGSDPGAPNATYEITSEDFQIPSYFQLSAAYNFALNEQNNLITAATFTANNSLEDMMNVGLEYGFMNVFFIRGGYNLALSDQTTDNIYGLTFGAGIDYKIGNGVGITFDYAFQDVNEFPTSNQIFTVKMWFE